MSFSNLYPIIGPFQSLRARVFTRVILCRVNWTSNSPDCLLFEKRGRPVTIEKIRPYGDDNTCSS